MVGVLASWKSLQAIPLKSTWQNRMANPNIIKDLFVSNKRVLNLVHFNTEANQKDHYREDMLKIKRLAGPNFNGFQLNMAWPDIVELQRYRSFMGYQDRIVLQLGRRALELADNSPRKTASLLSPYSTSINDILFDPSGGKGQPFNVNTAYNFLSAIADRGWDIGMGVAGGLGPNSLDLLEPLIEKFPDLNIDAEGKLRDSEGNLDLQAVKNYLDQAACAFN